MLIDRYLFISDHAHRYYRHLSISYKVCQCLITLNKRAMMALDHSPESFPHKMNSTFFVLLLQHVTLGWGPALTPGTSYMNKIDKGQQRHATYHKSKLYPFQFQRRVLKLVFFVPMFQFVTPEVGSVLTKGESYE